MTAPSQLRQTHTVVVLGISQPAFEEISAKLRAADYGHCFMPDGEVDMSGIAVALDPEARPRAYEDSDPGDCPELNMSNYDHDGVAALNAWAVQADACIDRLNGRVKELEEEVALDDKLLDQRLQLLREITACEAHGETCVPHAREWVRTAKSGLDIADRQMFVVLASYGAGSGDIYRPPAGEYGSEEFHEAASWLLQRGYVERGEDEASAFLRVLRRPLVALTRAHGVMASDEPKGGA